MNPYYSKQFDVLPGSQVGSQRHEDEYQLIEQGFDKVDIDVTTVVDASAAAVGAAATATGQAVAAAQSAATALSLSNFKGNWAAGTYTAPACVKHLGRFWLLGVPSTTGTPSVSADWVASDQGVVPTAVITGNTTGVVGVRYLIAANLTLTAPTTWLKGDYFGFREVAGVVGAIVDFGATKVRGIAAGAMRIDVPRAEADLFYEDATRGLV